MIAFEISVNGEHQYTVGAENWQNITSSVFGHHIEPDRMRKMAGEEIPDLPAAPFDHLRLHSGLSGESVSTILIWTTSPGESSVCG